MKGYSYQIEEDKKDFYAKARVEGVDASFKDLAEVCGRIRGLTTDRALELLEKFKDGELPVLYKSHNKKLGHRRELGGKKGRYPKKAAFIVLKALKSAMANAVVKGMLEPYILVHASANKKRNYPRLVPKGRRGRSDYETARVEIVLMEKELGKSRKNENKSENKNENKSKSKDEHKSEIDSEVKSSKKVAE